MNTSRATVNAALRRMRRTGQPSSRHYAARPWSNGWLYTYTVRAGARQLTPARPS